MFVKMKGKYLSKYKDIIMFYCHQHSRVTETIGYNRSTEIISSIHHAIFYINFGIFYAN